MTKSHPGQDFERPSLPGQLASWGLLHQELHEDGRQGVSALLPGTLGTATASERDQRLLILSVGVRRLQKPSRNPRPP